MKINFLSFIAVGALAWYFYRDIKKKQLKQVGTTTSFGVRG